MTLFIVLLSVAAYWAVGLFVARPVYTAAALAYQKDVVAWKKRHASSYYLPAYDRPGDWSVGVALLVAAFWPEWLMFQGLMRFLNKPLRQRAKTRDELTEQLKFWTDTYSHATPGSQQRDLAETMQREIKAKLKEYS